MNQYFITIYDVPVTHTLHKCINYTCQVDYFYLYIINPFNRSNYLKYMAGAMFQEGNRIVTALCRNCNNYTKKPTNGARCMMEGQILRDLRKGSLHRMGEERDDGKRWEKCQRKGCVLSKMKKPGNRATCPECQGYHSDWLPCKRPEGFFW